MSLQGNQSETRWIWKNHFTTILIWNPGDDR